MRLVVVGLGRLGSPMSAVLAASGFTVVGVDPNEATVRAINTGVAPVAEPGLADMMLNAGGRLSATTNYADALMDADLSFVVVPTPSGEDGTFSLTYVLSAVRSIGTALRAASGRRHVVVITSTVMPGSTVGPIREALEESSGLAVGRDVGLCYSPEFIALGSVVNDLTRPDMILVGESDPDSGDTLLSVLGRVTSDGTPSARMDGTSAEIAKLAVNTFVTTKISYANMLAEICERLPNADASLVTAAVGMDSRIGAKYLRPGAPYGGPCFPRDNVALAALARALGVRADIAEATDAINRRQLDRVMDLVNRNRDSGTRVAILGLSYKPGTPVRDESFGVDLVRRCVEEGLEVFAWDPMCRVGVSTQGLASAVLSDSLAECLGVADIAVVATPWPELAQLPSIVRETGRPKVVIDCWRLFGANQTYSGAVMVHGGRGIPNERAFAQAVD